MWNVVKSAVKEFVVALNEDDEDGDISTSIVQDSIPPQGAGTNIDDKHLGDKHLGDDVQQRADLDLAIAGIETDKHVRPIHTDKDGEEELDEKTATNHYDDNSRLSSSVSATELNLSDLTWSKQTVPADRATNLGTIQKTIELMKSEHEWMEKMWKAERTNLLKKLERAEQRNRNCQCDEKVDGAAVGGETGDPNQVAKLNESTSLLDSEKDSLDALRRRISDLKEENQLLRVSIKKLLTNIYSQDGVAE